MEAKVISKKSLVLYIAVAVLALCLFGGAVYLASGGKLWKENLENTDQANNKDSETQEENEEDKETEAVNCLQTIPTDCNATLMVSPNLELTLSSSINSACFLEFESTTAEDESIVVVIDENCAEASFSCEEVLGLSALECAVRGHSANQAFTFDIFTNMFVGEKSVSVSEYQAEIDFFGTPMSFDEVAYGYQTESGTCLVIWGHRAQSDQMEEIIMHFE